MAETRRRGYSFNEGRIVAGMCAIGAPAFGPRGRVAAAISGRMSPSRQAEIVTLLKAQAARLDVRIAETGGRAPPVKAS